MISFQHSHSRYINWLYQTQTDSCLSHQSFSICSMWSQKKYGTFQQTTQGIFRCKYAAFIESLIKKYLILFNLILIKNALNLGSKGKNIIWALLFWKRWDFLCHPQCEWHQLSYPRLLCKSGNRARDKKHQKKDLVIQFNTIESLYKKDLLPMHRREEPWGPEESESVTVLTWSTNRTCIHVTN